MDFDKALGSLTPDIVARFRTAIETGRWPDGRELTTEQKEICMQAIIAFEHKNVPEKERTGYVPPKSTPCEPGDEKPIKWE